MRALLATVVLGVASILGAQQPRVTAILPGFRTPVWMDTTGLVRVFPAPRERALDAVGRVLKDAGIELEVRNADAGLIGNGRIKTQRRFAGDRISAWLDCGAGGRGMHADTYRVSISILGMVRAITPTSTEVRLAFAAGAQDFAGPLGDPISCSSTGRLEERLLGKMAALLGSEG